MPLFELRQRRQVREVRDGSGARAEISIDHGEIRRGRRHAGAFDAPAEDTGVPTLLRRLGEIGVDFKDLDTTTTTLEDIFVDLVGRAA